jgi:hypothetical protein
MSVSSPMGMASYEIVTKIAADNTSRITRVRWGLT